MKVLAIDTSRRQVCVCVLTDETGAVIECAESRDESVATALPRHLQSLLRDDLNAVVVVTGPGSYTGVRGGMAAALGVAAARGLPLYGIGTLEVLAHGAPTDAVDVVAVHVAGRGGADLAAFKRVGGVLEPLGEPEHVTLEEWSAPADQVIVNYENVDAFASLAACVPAAMRRAPLEQFGLQATQVSHPQFAVPKARV